MDDPLLLARVQFALTAGSHFLFVALTLGLATLVALTQTIATLSGSAVAERMTRFWGQLYVINYAVGIVTGLVMEFQFGLNWSGMSRVVGEVFGAPLAMETVVAFFVESTFLGLWIFGWDRLNRWVHLALIWVVAATAYFSAYFILVANGFLQRPVGYRMQDGVARLTDVGALLTNPTALLAFGHVVFGGLLTAGFFMAAVSGYHLFRRTAEADLFRRSMRTGLVAVVLSVFPVAMFGGTQFRYVQPTKHPGTDEAAAQVAQFQARFGPGDYTPPGLASVGEIAMVSAWMLMSLVALVALVKLPFGRWLERGRVFHVLVMAALPLPYVAVISGWVFREVGRQPWMVYGVLTTEDALSDVPAGAVTASFVVFTAVFAVLVAVNVWLLARYARRGPEAVRLGALEAPEPERPVLTPSL
ncbi:cytochrome ubiquinol oxidase subunit I [Actinomadura sp. NBRC 104425]|uniref:cytochrome ubiquinol oxidase subunit I n=1 Tax=Actinomadura sp. NBRC 104425 TaxID=3032204 RepID=UPI0024A08721|nr:cytochrome ubiquinol oxidase subunit I [Actinomadura sp. NBRC 104425]GLZ11939.1 cytochrome ubiquinol oxidase subunit I [Actinomadura sp. NBRC 104425]